MAPRLPRRRGPPATVLPGRHRPATAAPGPAPAVRRPDRGRRPTPGTAMRPGRGGTDPSPADRRRRAPPAPVRPNRPAAGIRHRCGRALCAPLRDLLRLDGHALRSGRGLGLVRRRHGLARGGGPRALRRRGPGGGVDVSGRGGALDAVGALGPLGGRDGLASLGRLPDHLAVGTLDPLALGPLLAAVAGLLLGQLGLTLDVDPPPGQAGRQPGILALLADGQRQLVVAHDDRGRAGQVVEPDLPHPGRCQRASG